MEILARNIPKVEHFYVYTLFSHSGISKKKTMLLIYIRMTMNELEATAVVRVLNWPALPNPLVDAFSAILRDRHCILSQ